VSVGALEYSAFSQSFQVAGLRQQNDATEAGRWPHSFCEGRCIQASSLWCSDGVGNTPSRRC
jgi:hypothetical protein